MLSIAHQFASCPSGLVTNTRWHWTSQVRVRNCAQS